MIYASPKAEGEAVSTLTDAQREALQAMKVGPSCYCCGRSATLLSRDGDTLRKTQGGQLVCGGCLRRVLPREAA